MRLGFGNKIKDDIEYHNEKTCNNQINNIIEKNKRICIQALVVYGIGMILTILLGVVIQVSFEIVNAVLVLVGIGYSLFMRKLSGDNDYKIDSSILISSAILKLIFMFSVIYEVNTWYGEEIKAAEITEYYMLYVIFYVQLIAETIYFLRQKKSLKYRRVILNITLMSYVAFVFINNSFWVLLILVPVFITYLQCDDVKYLARRMIFANVIAICGGLNQSDYYDTKEYSFITEIPGYLKRAISNLLIDESEHMLCTYIIICTLLIMFSVSMLSVTKLNKDINNQRIKNIENEQERIEKLTSKIIDIGMKIKLNSFNTTKVVDELDKSSNDSGRVLKDIARETENNVSRIEKQTEMTFNISSLINDVANEVNKASVTTKKSMDELEKSKISFVNLKAKSDKIYDGNKQIIETIDKFIMNARRIKGITEKMEYILDETRLLSYNTHIKSAKAMELGKGFEVIANQINNLALQTSDLTIKVTEIVEKLEDSASDVYKVVHDVVSAIEDETYTLDKSMDAFGSMAQQMHSLDTSVYDMSNKLDNVEKFNDEIKSHISKLMASSEEVTASTTNLVELNKVNTQGIKDTRKLIDNMLIDADKLEEYSYTSKF
ncbi:MAG: methyl-accepting chemotaxis protein [Lachnospiraceae bacterium]|nr:methyl-accepting chemotaxis protein [Lachnospiraceae bacterium]